jgi:chemotaxis protein MotB
MAGKQKQQEEESGEGAPLWIISFADMISLLMAFFVMLASFSGLGPKESAKLRKVITAAIAPNFYGGWYKNPPLGTMGHQMPATGQAEKGSEKPTLEEAAGSGSLADTGLKDFRSRKVLLIESEKVVWASGTTLSTQGRDFLSNLCLLASVVPGRIAVSEVGSSENPDIGVLRAVAVVEYLGSQGVSKSRCSIGTRAILPETNFKTERMLEIVLLD